MELGIGLRPCITAVALAAMLAIAGSAVAKAETLRLGHITPPSHVWHKVAARFAENLGTRGDDGFEVAISPLSKLGNEPVMISLLQTGAMHFALLTAGGLSNRVEALNGWFLPYVFEDVRDAGNAIKLPAAQAMLKQLEAHGLIGLGYAFAGQRHVLSIAPVTEPGDLVHKKIRAFPSAVFNDWWLAVGAAPTALPLGEIASSLTTKLLDAVDVDLDIVVGLKFYEQAPYLALTNHMAFPAVMVASKKWWDGLSASQQVLIREAYAEAEAWGIDQQALAEVANLQALKDAGTEVTEIKRAQFREIGSQVRNLYTANNSTIADFYKQVSGH